jgi:hypothetical protein
VFPETNRVEHDASEIGFCLRLQVKHTQLSPIERASLRFRSKRDFALTSYCHVAVYNNIASAIIGRGKTKCGVVDLPWHNIPENRSDGKKKNKGWSTLSLYLHPRAFSILESGGKGNHTAKRGDGTVVNESQHGCLVGGAVS